MAKLIPLAQGVPGTYWQQPPTWLTGTPFPVLNTLDDPRWRGATRQGFPLTGGTKESVGFRALYHVSGGVTSLYLSFNVAFDPVSGPTLATTDKLFLGLSSGGNALVIEVTPYSAAVAAVNQPATSFTVYQRSGTTWNSIAQPTWIDTNTRVWVNTTPASWAVQMRIPLVGASLTDNAGPGLADPFRLWYFVRVMTPGGPALYEWLRPTTPATPATAAGDIILANFPDPATWDNFQRSGGGAVDDGIELRWNDIGTTNPNSSEILFRTSTPPPRPVNTFFCRPRNYSANPPLAQSIAANQLVARFRMVNWGSVASPDIWQDIPGGGMVQNPASIPPLLNGNDPPATNPLTFTWEVSSADITNFNLNTTPGARTHKCMLVELAGPGLTFRNDSAYRNMDFVQASLFRREATINIAGLTPITPRFRDVYLGIETVNMPAQVTQPPPRPAPAATAVAKNPQRRASMTHHARFPYDNYYPEEPDQDAEPDLEELLTSTPTYIVHVYHDTGERVDINGVTYPVLHEQSPFGYYVEHDGPLTGWRHQVQAPPEAQLTQIAPNFYRIAVPNGGEVKIVTEIEAKETPDSAPDDDAGDVLRGCLVALFSFLIAFARLLVRVFQEVIKLLRG